MRSSAPGSRPAYRGCAGTGDRGPLRRGERGWPLLGLTPRMTPALLAWTLLAPLCLLTSLVAPAGAAPFAFTDVYTPRCPPLPIPAPGNFTGFQNWSDPKTWGGGAVPGIGDWSNGSSVKRPNVTIPCGKRVLLDVPNLTLNMLTIRGLLTVYDPPAGAPLTYQVSACLVLVEGQLVIGSAAQQFRSQITFTLAPNPWGRQDYSASYNPPADAKHPRSVGHKAFVVMGGRVELHGVPGGASGADTPAWVKLAETADVGSTSIVVDADVSNSWAVGARLAIASSGYYYFEAEDFTITGIQPHPKGSIITLDGSLRWMHYGDPRGVPDGFGGYVDERAEVALLSRRIVITGEDEPPPHQYEGGHFMIFMTQGPQAVEGVEFYLMGQQGKLGRYSLHLHACGDTGGQFVVRKNAIHSSKQRCIVVHATHNVTVDSNVAYNTAGHCFMIEEGGEQDNSFLYNLGFLTRSVDRLITDGEVPGASMETDVVPSTFWITNLYNTYIGNVAAGSEDTGFWTELRQTVRGMSAYIPQTKQLRPQFTQIKVMRDNVAHSNAHFGFRTYPHGINPRTMWDASSGVPAASWPVGNGRIENLRAFKNVDSAVFMHSSSYTYVVNGTFADNMLAIDINDNYQVGAIDSTFVGLPATNLDTLVPYWCTSSNGPFLCGPLTGCSLNLSDTANLRMTGGHSWLDPRFGILIRHYRIGYDGGGSQVIRNNRFSRYDSLCGRTAAAIGVGLNGIQNSAVQWWNTGQAVEKLKLAPGTTPIWFPPLVYTYPYSGYNYSSGETSLNYAIWDKDGSVVGGRGGFVIAADPFLRPPEGQYSCRNLTGSGGGALACPGTCYRTLYFAYQEKGFSSLNGTKLRKRGDFSFVTITRRDPSGGNVTRVSDGNLNDFQAYAEWRRYTFSVLAPGEYQITISPPSRKPTWAPAGVTIGFRDGGGCGGGVTITLNPVSTSLWSIAQNDDQFLSPCPGVVYERPLPVQYSTVCNQNKVATRLVLDGRLSYYLSVTATAQRKAPQCRNETLCGVYASASTYWYTTSPGTDLHSPAPGLMGFQMPLYRLPPGWAKGQAIIGYAGWDWAAMRTITAPVNGSTTTYYYRKEISVSSSACYTGMQLDFYATQALVAYLNRQEIFRFNLPGGRVKNTTRALGQLWWPGNSPGAFNSTLIDLTRANASLVEGKNYLAFETHVAGPSQSYSYFDTRVILVASSPSCQGRKRSPEVCDGLDNDDDGTTDVDPATGAVLSRPCSTVCGAGVETCVGGAYQGCTARQPQEETCNSRDDDCDGLVDNSSSGGEADSQLNCMNGTVCFNGACLATLPATYNTTLVPPGAPGWRYLAAGDPLYAYPKWTTGVPSTVLNVFSAGQAPLGTRGAPSGPFSTVLPDLKQGTAQYYFLYSLNLTAADAASTQSLTVRFRRSAGGVVFANGIPVIASNMPDWFDPYKPDQESVNANDPNTDVNQWYTNDASVPSGYAAGTVRGGVNWVAATVAVARANPLNALFDLAVYRNVNATCSMLPGKPRACVRYAGGSTRLLNFYSTWKYLDASFPVPGPDWKGVGYNDSWWPSKGAILGNQQGSNSIVMNRSRIAYYFRKTLDIPDGHCYFDLQALIRVVDGAIFYVNGAEAYRFQFDMDDSPITSTTYSSDRWPPQSTGSFSLSAGWLRGGRNVIAAELHLSSQNTGNWFFDLFLSGQKEVVTCSASTAASSPPPASSSPPLRAAARTSRERASAVFGKKVALGRFARSSGSPWKIKKHRSISNSLIHS